MEILFLCGVFDSANTYSVVNDAKAPVEFSANLFQQKMIEGFEKNESNFYILSAPFIGSFPNASRKVLFKGFDNVPQKYEYVKFNNLWGYRNISRAKALKKAVKAFAEKKGEKLIVIYSAHTPFLEAAAYAKGLDKSIKICLIVPDLPEYMNLRADRSKLYDIAKKYDIAKMHRLMDCIDSYVLLTEHMKEKLPVGDRAYLVREGIVSENQFARTSNPQTKEKYVVYTGKMDDKFGVKSLVDSFRYISDKDTYLVLCGTGDSDIYIRKAAERDSRIILRGQVTPQEAGEWQAKATVLVNPRPNNEEYTKYSFPSKNIEYLLTGKPVVAYMLDGMPKHYIDYIYHPSETEDVAQSLAQSIVFALNVPKEIHNDNAEKYWNYAKENLAAEQFVKKIIELSYKDKGI